MTGLIRCLTLAFVGTCAIGAGIFVSASPAHAKCGGSGQRACKVWERVPSCNRGLREIRGRCVRPRPDPRRCGKLNQRACKITERIPSCDRGLREVRGRCVKGRPLSCGKVNQPPCTVVQRIPSCFPGLKRGLPA